MLLTPCRDAAGSRWLRRMSRPSRSSHARRAAGFTRQPRIADQMTPTYHALLDQALLAEQAGDAAAARALHGGIPMFVRSGHQVYLAQLEALAEEMQPWMWARWAAYQATRLDGHSRTAARGRAALRTVVETCYQHRLEETHDRGGDSIQVLSRVVGWSWAYHHAAAFDFGALGSFLDELATGRLREEAGTARAWTDVPMGGYRLECADPGDLRVTDLASGRSLPLLDLGAATHTGEGGWLIGRVVPSGCEVPLMFDNRPLPVDEATARRVAADPAPLGWLHTLATALEEGRVDRSLLDSEDREPVTDVLSLSLLERGTPPAALAMTLQQLSRGRDEIGRAAYRILREVTRGEFGPDGDAAYVAAAIVNPHAYLQAWRGLAVDTPPERWRHWAALVPDPARRRLLRLAGDSA